MKIVARKLQHLFSKHAADFGITGTWNPANAALLEKVLQDHVANPMVQKIPGTYRGTIGVIHHFDAATDRNVMVDTADELVGGWKLSAAQKKHLLASGNIQ
jgi:hypothetical protein